MNNVIPFPVKVQDTKAHDAAVGHITLCWELLDQENDGVDIDWSAYPVMAPFCGCTDCVVREIMHAGLLSLLESGDVHLERKPT